MGGLGSPRDLSRGVVPQGKKVGGPRCGIGGRGAADLRSDQAIEEAARERVISQPPIKEVMVPVARRRISGSDRRIGSHAQGTLLVSAWRTLAGRKPASRRSSMAKSRWRYLFELCRRL